MQDTKKVLMQGTGAIHVSHSIHGLFDLHLGSSKEVAMTMPFIATTSEEHFRTYDWIMDSSFFFFHSLFSLLLYYKSLVSF